MPEITFRPCRPEDVELAVPLIYSSGPAAFNYVFNDSAEHQALDFLHSAFVRDDSEFGYRQHTAALLDDTLVGIGAVRWARQNLPFTLAALWRILAFYRPAAALRVLVRGLRTEQVIHPPGKGVGILYHLGVAPQHRGRGIGRQLVERLLDTVRERGLATAALDVAATNPQAQLLYERIGFSVRHRRSGGLQSAFGAVADHRYMEMDLSLKNAARLV